MLDKAKGAVIQMFIQIDKLVYLLFKATTKVDKRLIVFEGTGGFDESSWVLYHYLKAKGKYKFVWMLGKPSKYKNEHDTKFLTRRYRSFSFVAADYYYAKAGYSFYTHMTSFAKPKREGQIVVFIGHGYAIKGHKGNGNSYHNFDYALAIGEEAICTQALFVGCTPDKMLPLGLPRNDLLLRNNRSGNENPFTRGRKYSKVIMWMPTFREANNALSESSCATETGLPLLDTPNKMEGLNEYLLSQNFLIILKIHRLQLQKEIFNREFSNIVIINDADIDELGLQLYQVIGLSDALLTDYSSVSVDYLLLDKPIGYVLSDIDLYVQDRGFTSNDPRDVMAGHLIYSVDDLYDFFSDLSEGKDEYREKRHCLRKRLHKAERGNSCELIADYFGL